MDLRDSGIDPLGNPRNIWNMIAADRQYDIVSTHVAGICFKQKAAALILLQPCDGHTFADRSRDFLCVVFDIGDDIVAQHEAFRIVSGIGESGQLALPVRRHQAECIPALGFP